MLTNFPNGISSFGVPIIGGARPPLFRRALWVKKTTDADYDEFIESKQFSYDNAGGILSVYNSLTAAVAAAGAWDCIFVTPGEYDEGAVVTITQQGLKIIGANTAGSLRGCMLFGYSATHDLLHIKADDVEIAGLGIVQYKAALGISIAEDAWGLNTWRTHIHDCFFNGGSIATYGVWFGGIGTEAVNTTVERCWFNEFTTAAVRMNGSISSVQRCFFHVPTAAIGIEDIPNVASRPYRLIADNYFTTSDAVDAYGVKVTNTPSAGQLMVVNNRFINFADDNHCISKRTGYTSLNYLGITAIPIT